MPTRDILRWLALAAMVVGISAGHGAVGVLTHEEHVLHVILRAAYLLPILTAAVWYGWPGGVALTTAVSIIYSVHLARQWSDAIWERPNQIAMIGVYWVTGLMTGALVTLEQRAERLRRLAEERAQRDLLIHGLSALEVALKFRDAYTETHGREVGALAAEIAHRLGLSEDRIGLVELAGRVHDLGKIGIRDDVLHKPESLTPEERRRIEQHPQIAADILAAVPGAQRIAAIVSSHHEYLDGSGYPRGLRGSDISLESQIITAADVYCALTEDRDYHRGRSAADTFALIDSWVPARLRADVVQALRQCVAHELAAPHTAAHGA